MAQASLTHAKSTAEFRLADALRTVATDHGRSYGEVVRDIARTAFGPGKLKAAEYFWFRLWDGTVDAQEMARFAGRRVEARANGAINFDSHWWAVAQDKILFQGVLRGAGLPTPELVALVHPGRAFPGVTALASADALKDWLREAPFPLFGKPNDTRWSLGTASLTGIDGDALIGLHDDKIPLNAFVDDVMRYAYGGYLFQRRVDPHPALAALSGPALGTIRVLAIRDASKPRILRTHAKIPSGHHVADNFWRTGNILADVDPDTGTLGRAQRGAGFESRPLTEHPDTGHALQGTVLPHWDAVRAAVTGAMRYLTGLRLVGWDVAIGRDGPVLVEANVDPDWAMSQLVSRRGLWTPDLAAVVEQCRGLAKERNQRLAQTGA